MCLFRQHHISKELQSERLEYVQYKCAIAFQTQYKYFPMTTSQKRLAKEILKFEKNKPADLSLETTTKQNVLIATIKGPRDTFWVDNEYKLLMEFGSEYPHKPPSVKFITQIYHPNVYTDGRICLDLLSNEWSPIYDLQAVLTAIRSLLSDPNTDSPANSYAAEMYNSHREQFEKLNKKGHDEILKHIQEEDDNMEDEYMIFD